MTRKTLVTALSIIYLLNGFWHIGVFLSSLIGSSKSIELDLTRLMGGVLALYVGWYLFKLEEFGRKLAIFLLWVRVGINLYFMVWLLLHQESAVSSGLYFLDKEIYRIANPDASEIFLVVWMLIALLTIVFLSQGETRRLFATSTTNDPKTLVESSHKEAS
jgi:hypothetical protein